jgi:hypothetical protein
MAKVVSDKARVHESGAILNLIGDECQKSGCIERLLLYTARNRCRIIVVDNIRFQVVKYLEYVFHLGYIVLTLKMLESHPSSLCFRFQKERLGRALIDTCMAIDTIIRIREMCLLILCINL